MVPFHKWLWPPIMEKMDYIEGICIDTVFWYNRTKIHVYHYFDYYYTQFPVFRFLADLVSLPIILINAVVLGAMYRRVEPADSTVSLFYTDFSKNKIIDTKNQLCEVGDLRNYGDPKPIWLRVKAHLSNNHTKPDAEFKDEIASAITAAHTFAALDDGRDVLIVARQNPYYIILSPESSLPIIPPKKSHVEFFVVQYMNSGMKTAVQLHVPTNMLYVGNELFRPAFILWLLEQEPLLIDYVFDEHYVITIMDQNIEERHLTSNQYIVLGEDDYEVRRIV